MQKGLKPLLHIQELDIKMIRLMRVKKQRQGELKQIESLRTELKEQLKLKEEEIKEIETQVNSLEEKIQTLTDKYKKLESQQGSVKKVEEFNALTQEMTTVEREKVALETQTSNILDQKVAEEEILEKIKESLVTSETNSIELEKDIKSSIDQINTEGQQLKAERDQIVGNADADSLKIYERLLRNKKDRVIVPIENRTCSGCHIALTLQHENLVRKGESVAFCEHCSRIHYWEESETVEGATAQSRRRRRRTVKA
ncbi:MAG: zinc ribbon domain-containing protein [Candidatus Neptunochlamydia sp.]|nr:zinc ribbon domain-containing protein [Candidatus Neptunochlamydia sp.]